MDYVYPKRKAVEVEGERPLTWVEIAARAAAEQKAKARTRD